MALGAELQVDTGPSATALDKCQFVMKKYQPALRRYKTARQ